MERWMAASRQSGRSGAIGMRSIPIDNRIYGGKLAKEGDEIGDARVRGNSERWKPLRRGKPANSPYLPLSLSLSIFFSCRRSIFPIFVFYPLRPSSVLSSSLFLFPFPFSYPYLQILRPLLCSLPSTKSTRGRDS